MGHKAGRRRFADKRCCRNFPRGIAKWKVLTGPIMRVDLRYLLASVAATAAFTFLALAFPNVSRLFTTPAAIGCFGLTLYLLWPEVLEFHKSRLNRVIALMGMVICGVGFICFAGLYLWPSSPPQEPSTRNEPVHPARPAPEAAPIPEPTGVYKFIVDGLTKARADLLGIKKEELSCNALAQWQERASTATRLAHANNIQIHNPISQHLSACQNSTDVELLSAIRMSVVNLLDQGIQAVRAGGG